MIRFTRTDGESEIVTDAEWRAILADQAAIHSRDGEAWFWCVASWARL